MAHEKLSLEDRLLVAATVQQLRRQYYELLRPLDSVSGLFTMHVATAFSAFLLAETYVELTHLSERHGTQFPPFATFMAHAKEFLGVGMTWSLKHLHDNCEYCQQARSQNGNAANFGRDDGGFDDCLGPEPPG